MRPFAVRTAATGFRFFSKQMAKYHAGCGIVVSFKSALKTFLFISQTPTNDWSPRASGWRRGVVVSGVRRMNEVNAHRARLVPGWVTVFGQVYHLGM